MRRLGNGAAEEAQRTDAMLKRLEEARARVLQIEQAHQNNQEINSRYFMEQSAKNQEIDQQLQQINASIANVRAEVDTLEINRDAQSRALAAPVPSLSLPFITERPPSTLMPDRPRGSRVPRRVIADEESESSNFRINA